MIDIKVGDGKYRAIFSDQGKITVFRYGQIWRDCTGDGFVLALMQEIDKLKEEK